MKEDIDPHHGQKNCRDYFQEGSCGYSWEFRGEGRQTTAGWLEPAIFDSNSGCLIFGIFRVEANIIMRHHEVPYRLASDPAVTVDFSASLSRITV